MLTRGRLQPPLSSSDRSTGLSNATFQDSASRKLYAVVVPFHVQTSAEYCAHCVTLRRMLSTNSLKSCVTTTPKQCKPLVPCFTWPLHGRPRRGRPCLAPKSHCASINTPYSRSHIPTPDRLTTLPTCRAQAQRQSLRLVKARLVRCRRGPRRLVHQQGDSQQCAGWPYRRHRPTPHLPPGRLRHGRPRQGVQAIRRLAGECGHEGLAGAAHRPLDRCFQYAVPGSMEKSVEDEALRCIKIFPWHMRPVACRCGALPCNGRVLVICCSGCSSPRPPAQPDPHTECRLLELFAVAALLPASLTVSLWNRMPLCDRGKHANSGNSHPSCML